MTPSDSATGQRIARAILAGFDKHYRLFRAMAVDAKDRFERADWHAVKDAHRTRIDLYAQRVKEAVATLRATFPDALDEKVWPAVKHAYIELLLGHQQPECAETFFNSVACRILDRSYFHTQYLFWRPSVSTENIEGRLPTYRAYYPATNGLTAMLKQMLADFGLKNAWEDLDRDVGAVIRSLWELLPRPVERHPDAQLQVLPSLFFRNKAAYVVGTVIGVSLAGANPQDHTPWSRRIRVPSNHIDPTRRVGGIAVRETPKTMWPS